MCAAGATGGRAAGHALAVLGYGVIPGTATHAAEEVVLDVGLTGRIVVVPLGAPVDQVDSVRAGLDADSANTTVVREIRASTVTRVSCAPDFHHDLGPVLRCLANCVRRR